MSRLEGAGPGLWWILDLLPFATAADLGVNWAEHGAVFGEAGSKERYGH
jgi:hypothetical protein